ncbi:MAG: HAD family hydrolase [Treponema sp.]|nr:HAD family hydrolase [Treponema sp.]
MKKAYIFDLDGTLANTIYDIGDSINHLLIQRGLPIHSYEKYSACLGMGINITLSRTMSGYDVLPPEEKAALRRAYTIHNGEHCLDKTLPYEGIPETLKTLAERGAVLGIFTNKPEMPARKIAAALFANIDFAFVLGNVEGLSMKPDPSRMLAELEKLGITAAETVFVGDGGPDIATAKTGKMFACGVSWGFQGLKELDGADLVISHPRELLAI